MRLLLLALMLPVTACATASRGSLDALCLATSRDRDAHAAALVADGGDQSVTTGQALISKIDSACR